MSSSKEKEGKGALVFQHFITQVSDCYFSRKRDEMFQIRLWSYLE